MYLPNTKSVPGLVVNTLNIHTYMYVSKVNEKIVDQLDATKSPSKINIILGDYGCGKTYVLKV